MIHVKILKGDELQKLINIIKTFKLLNDYITLIFDNDGLYIQGMDNSHICLYELSIKTEWFELYNHTYLQLCIYVCNYIKLIPVASYLFYKIRFLKNATYIASFLRFDVYLVGIMFTYHSLYNLKAQAHMLINLY